MLEFQTIKSDSSLFIQRKGNETTYVLVYVDDFIVTESNYAGILKLTNHLNNVFKLKDLGELNYFLGIEVRRNRKEEIHLNQRNYILSVLKKAGMDNAKSMPTPMTKNLQLTKNDGDPIENAHQYGSIVGALQYITITRPEISYSVNKVCQFMQKPLDTHWKAVKRVLRYLAGTLDHGLKLYALEKLNMSAFADADWAADRDDRKSVSGYCVYLGKNLVAWC